MSSESPKYDPFAETVLRSRATATRGPFRLMFVGVVFAFFDFRLNSANIFPDIVGYLLLILAFRKQVDALPRFRVAGGFAIACCGCWLLSFVSDLSGLLPLAGPIAQCGLVWTMMQGIGEHLHSLNAPGWAMLARRVSIGFVSAVGLLTLMSLAGASGPVASVLLLGFFVSLVLMFTVVWRTGSLTPISAIGVHSEMDGPGERSP